MPWKKFTHYPMTQKVNITKVVTSVDVVGQLTQLIKNGGYIPTPTIRVLPFFFYSKVDGKPIELVIIIDLLQKKIFFMYLKANITLDCPAVSCVANPLPFF